MSRPDLNNKIWYRALKLFSIFAAIGLYAFVGIIAINEFPEGSVVGRIECSNGKTIYPDLPPVFRLPGEDLDHANIRCATRTLSKSERSSPIGTGRAEFIANHPAGDLSYEYFVTRKPVSAAEAMEHIGQILIVFSVLTGIFWLFKRSFFYIGFGEKFFQR